MSLRAQAKQSNEIREIATAPAGPRNDFLLIFVLITLCLTSCVSNYNLKAQFAHAAYHEGRYEAALSLIEKVKPAGRDRLLYLMDKGMIAHAAGKYGESNKVLTEAEDLSDALSAKSISRETAATLWSEEATEYGGEKYERTMIPVIRMLNYIMQDEWDEALVEVRRLLTIAEKIYGDPKELSNAFAIYLSAVIWETLGQINDALISYNQLTKHKKDVPYYGYDANFLRSKLGITAELPPGGSTAWTTSGNYRKNKGELLVIAEAGRSPIFVAETATNLLFTVSMPELYTFPQVLKSVKVSIDGKDAGRTYPFYNILEDIMKALKDRQKRSFIRKMIKLPVQTGLYAAGGELMKQDDTESKIAGIGLALLALSMSVSEKADERSWRTLPAQFQLGRFYLPAGRHEIEISPGGGGDQIKRTVEIAEGKPAVLLIAYPQSSDVPTKIAEPKGKQTMEADMAKAREFYEAGENAEDSKDYEEAADNYMLAYKCGDESAAEKVIETYKMTSDSFKKSDRGLEIANEFADSYLTSNPQ